MKKIIYKYLSGWCRTEWKQTDKKKVLIETNRYFIKETWESVFEKYGLKTECEAEYYGDKYCGFKLVKEADVLFTFGVNQFYDLSNLGIIYTAASGASEIKNHSAKTFSAKGIAKYAMAEYCLAAALNMIYGFDKIGKNISEKTWKQGVFMQYDDLTVRNKTAGILGLGEVGTAVSELFRTAGFKTAGFDTDESRNGITDTFCTGMDELLKMSDIVIIAVRADDTSKEIISAAELFKMKKSAYLINISRGSVLNEKDLIKALNEERIAGAVLDVVKNEPLSRYNKLWTAKNILITPHIAGNVNMFTKEIMIDFCAKLSKEIRNG